MVKKRTEQLVAPAGRGDETRALLKSAARRLFAEHGVDEVSVRDIVKAADQKNGGSLHYYFTNKEGLIREIVADGAQIIDERRSRELDEAEARGGPETVREVVEIIVRTSLHVESDDGGETYTRFIYRLQRNYRSLFLAALEERWDVGFRRCVAHLRRLLAHVPAAVQNDRIILMLLLLTAALSAREDALERDPEIARNDIFERIWLSSGALDTLIDTMEGMLCHAVRPSEVSEHGSAAIERGLHSSAESI